MALTICASVIIEFFIIDCLKLRLFVLYTVRFLGGVTNAIPQIQFLKLSPELSYNVIKRSKQEGTTVHGALSAALLSTAKAWKPNPIRLFIPSSARETLETGETVSLSIGSRIIPFDMETTDSFWDIARIAKKALTGIDSKEEIFGFAKSLSEVITSGVNAQGTTQINNTLLANEYLLSNVGALPFDSDFGKLKLDALWGPFTLSGYEGSQTIGIATIHGIIHMALTSPGNMQIKPLLESIEQILSVECAPANNI
jgi:hypothetical protein